MTSAPLVESNGFPINLFNKMSSNRLNELKQLKKNLISKINHYDQMQIDMLKRN